MRTGQQQNSTTTGGVAIKHEKNSITAGEVATQDAPKEKAKSRPAHHIFKRTFTLLFLNKQTSVFSYMCGDI